jgi:hypothetical protein
LSLEGFGTKERDCCHLSCETNRSLNQCVGVSHLIENLTNPALLNMKSAGILYDSAVLFRALQFLPLVVITT